MCILLEIICRMRFITGTPDAATTHVIAADAYRKLVHIYLCEYDMTILWPPRDLRDVGPQQL